MTDPDDLVEVLARRHDVLRALLEEPRERHVLVDDLESSKSTVYKGVSQLQERGLVRPTSNGLRPTLLGLVALERYDELARTADLGQLLADLPPDTIDPAALLGAEAVVPDRRSVDRHLARLERIFQEAESIRGFSPAVSPEQTSIFHDRTTSNRLQAEYVLPREIVGYLHRLDPTGFEETVAAENVVFYQTDRDLRISLFLASSADGTEVCVGLGEEGVATGLIVNDTAESRRWAEAEFEELKRSAERLTAGDLPPE